MATSTPGGGGQTNLGVAPNVGGLLCYVPCCIGLIFSIVAVIVEKKSRFVRFHAFQSLLLHAVGIAATLILMFLQVVLATVGLGAVGGLVMIIQWVVAIALGAVMILMMIKANGNEEFELPGIGSMAKGWV
jgi:uncharacterized membrane protein